MELLLDLKMTNPRDWKIQCETREDFEGCLKVLAEAMEQARKRTAITSNDTYESDLEARYERLADDYLKFIDAEEEALAG